MQLTTLNVPMKNRTLSKDADLEGISVHTCSGFDCCEGNLISVSGRCRFWERDFVKDLPIVTLPLEKYALKIHNDNLTYNISIHFFSLKSPA